MSNFLEALLYLLVRSASVKSDWPWWKMHGQVCASSSDSLIPAVYPCQYSRLSRLHGENSPLTLAKSPLQSSALAASWIVIVCSKTWQQYVPTLLSPQKIASSLVISCLILYRVSVDLLMTFQQRQVRQTNQELSLAIALAFQVNFGAFAETWYNWISTVRCCAFLPLQYPDQDPLTYSFKYAKQHLHINFSWKSLYLLYLWEARKLAMQSLWDVSDQRRTYSSHSLFLILCCRSWKPLWSAFRL